MARVSEAFLYLYFQPWQIAGSDNTNRPLNPHFTRMFVQILSFLQLGVEDLTAVC